MITKNMSLREAVEQVRDDYLSNAIGNKFDGLKKQFAKAYRLRQDYPLCMHARWTHPASRNVWLLMVKAYNGDQKKNPRMTMACMYEGPGGKYLMLPAAGSNIRHSAWILFPPHFFKRYRQRILKNFDMPASDVVETYFRRNPALAICLDQTFTDRLGLMHHYSEEIDFVAKAPEGTVFGIFIQPSPGIIIQIAKTIVSEGMLFDDQHEQQDWLKEEIRYMMASKASEK